MSSSGNVFISVAAFSGGLLVAFFYLGRTSKGRASEPSCDRGGSERRNAINEKKIEENGEEQEENDSELKEVKRQLEQMAKSREDERKGRIRAERIMRENVRKESADSGFTYKPIGICRSCFPKRNGTPRQPLLVPSGRASIQLNANIPSAALDSLDSFSHCWIIFCFDQNTDMHQKNSGRKTTLKGKIKPPQLNGKKVGILSTRTPHRPNSIGLSVAKIARVNILKRKVDLLGIDLIDGTTILDIKPYLPFDRVDTSTLRVPQWISDNAAFPKLDVFFQENVHNELSRYVNGKRSLWWKEGEADDFIETLRQVLSLDIRSKNKGRGKATGNNNAFSVSFDRVGVEVCFDTLDDGVHVTGVKFGGGK